MVFSLIDHVASSGGTTAGIDTTGADLLTSQTTDWKSNSPCTDSYGNVWTLDQGSSRDRRINMRSVRAPTVGTGHTFAGGSGDSVHAQAWSGVLASGAYKDKSQSGTEDGGGGALSLITPAESDELWVVCGYRDSGANPPTINSGFTLLESIPTTKTAAYLIQGAAAALTPAFTSFSNWGTPSAVLYKSEPASGGGTLAFTPGIMLSM